MPAVITGTPQSFVFADGNSGHLCTNTDGGPAATQWDVLCVNSNTTVSTPAGWLLAETKVTNQGAYMFARQAAGGEAGSVTLTTSGNHNTSAHWIRLAAADALDTSTSTEVNSSTGGSSPAHSTGLLGDDDEFVIAFSANHSIGAADQTAPIWSSGYTAILSSLQGSGASGVIGYTAYKSGAGTAAETPSVSWSGTGAFNRYMLVLTWTTLAAITASGAASTGAASASGTATVQEQTVSTGGSWETLRSIAREMRQLAEEERTRTRVACDYCGTPLESHRGILHCPHDGSIFQR